MTSYIFEVVSSGVVSGSVDSVSSIPEEADGLLLGGGYPELYAEELSANTQMLDSIRAAAGSGMPSLAECGGFMLLMDELEDKDGRIFPMAGVIHGRTFHAGRLTRFGYVTVSGKPSSSVTDGSGDADTLLTGLSIKGHEFHYYDSTDNGCDASAVKPGGGSRWDCIHAGKDHVWGYPHLYYPSCPGFIDRFRDAMDRYRAERGRCDG